MRRIFIQRWEDEMIQTKGDNHRGWGGKQKLKLKISGEVHIRVVPEER